VPLLSRAHRRSPCPCGSRRALADCCLPWEEAFQRLATRLVAFAETPAVRRMESNAAETFWGPGSAASGRTDRTARRQPAFAEWFLMDYIAPRRKGPLVGEFADRTEALGTQEEQLLFSLLLAPLRAYEVTESPTFHGVQVKDLLTGSETLMGPLGVPDGVIRSDICVGRLVSLGRIGRPGLSLLRLPPGSQAEMLAYLRATYRMARPGRHLSLDDYLDGAAHLYHQFFLDRGRDLGGRAYRTSRWTAFADVHAMYRSAEGARIRAALDRQPELEREDAAGVRYAWIDPRLGVARGRVRLDAEGIRANAETREDLDTIKGFLETSLRGLIRQAETPGEASPIPTVTPRVESPSPKQDPAGTSFLCRVVARWPDAPLPALGDQAPREACGSPDGREAVAQLLLGLERDMARQKRIGRAWAEVGPICEALGFPPTTLARGVASVER
jgi:hypothetical protein